MLFNNLIAHTVVVIIFFSRSHELFQKMANLLDTETELKEVVNMSDGDDHQLYENRSRKILRTEVHDEHMSESDLFRRLRKINEIRKISHSISDRSDFESLTS